MKLFQVFGKVFGVIADAIGATAQFTGDINKGLDNKEAPLNLLKKGDFKGAKEQFVTVTEQARLIYEKGESKRKEEHPALPFFKDFFGGAKKEQKVEVNQNVVIHGVSDPKGVAHEVTKANKRAMGHAQNQLNKGQAN